MTPEELIATLFSEYGQEVWLAFITFVATGFVMIMLKNFILDLVNYFRARMSDVGYGQRIYWRGEIFVVDSVKFQHIVAHDDKKKILIPISNFLGGVKEYPHHRYDDFDEKKYHHPRWDGKTERRKGERDGS